MKQSSFECRDHCYIVLVVQENYFSKLLSWVLLCFSSLRGTFDNSVRGVVQPGYSIENGTKLLCWHPMVEGRFVRSKNLAELIAICIYFKKWHWELRLCVILYFIAFEGWNQDKQKATFFLGGIPSLGLSFFSSGWWGIVLASKNTGSNIFVGGEAQILWETMTFLGIF